MSDILSMLQGVLQGGGYRTWLTSIDKRPVVCFEDDAVMGFVRLFDETTNTALWLERNRDRIPSSIR